MSRKLKFDIPGIDWRVRPDEIRELGLERLYAPELVPPLRLVVEGGSGEAGQLVVELLAEQSQRGITTVSITDSAISPALPMLSWHWI